MNFTRQPDKRPTKFISLTHPRRSESSCCPSSNEIYFVDPTTETRTIHPNMLLLKNDVFIHVYGRNEFRSTAGQASNEIHFVDPTTKVRSTAFKCTRNPKAGASPLHPK